MAKKYHVGPMRRFVNGRITSAIRKGKMADNMYLLTTLGRKSGRERTTPVTLTLCDGHRYLVSPYGNVGWVYNIRDSGMADLGRGGKTEEISVTEVDDADTVGPVLRQYVRENYTVGRFFDAGKNDPPGSFAAEASRHPVFRIKE
jgi:deazaflavin-dependent oxidoreductase (nitroreductase family)